LNKSVFANDNNLKIRTRLIRLEFDPFCEIKTTQVPS